MDEIYSLYFNDTYYFLLGLCSDPNLAEEICQETFFKVFKSLNTYKKDKDLRAWIFTIAKNTLYSYYRDNKKLIPTENFDQDCCQVNFVKNIEDKENSLKIHNFLHKMNEPYKEVFYLRVFGELSFKSIGQIFSRSDNWARIIFFRARQKILEWMEEEDLND